jgi:hypothetical protein
MQVLSNTRVKKLCAAACLRSLMSLRELLRNKFWRRCFGIGGHSHFERSHDRSR